MTTVLEAIVGFCFFLGVGGGGGGREWGSRFFFSEHKGNSILATSLIKCLKADFSGLCGIF